MEHTHDKHNNEHCTCSHAHVHNHGHHHDHEHCTCNHEHHHIHKETEDKFAHLEQDIQQKIYIIENLGCANCAAKMEKKINELSEVEAATITFATKQLRVASNHQED